MALSLRYVIAVFRNRRPPKIEPWERSTVASFYDESVGHSEPLSVSCLFCKANLAVS